MQGKKKKLWLQITGIVLVLLLAVLLLWHGNATSSQALMPMVAQVEFEGEYKIADGPWQKIVKGAHIPATKGDVILRGNFHIFAPNGEYIGIYDGDVPIALYVDHINLKIYEGGNGPFELDPENPLYGNAVCCVSWTAYALMNQSTDLIEIRIHNPHRFGNETAIDELLANTAFWTGIDFEKSALESGELQRNTGLFFMIVSLVVLGIALFSTLIHIKNSRMLWLIGLVIMFAGTYFAYSARGISFWSDSMVSNTTILGSAMIFYMLFLSMMTVYFLNASKKVGTIAVVCLGAVDAAMFLLPVVANVRFYDTWFYWAIAQMTVNLILIGCLIKECIRAKKVDWVCIGAILSLTAFSVDVAMTGLGIWKGGMVSEYVFIALSVVAMVVVLRIIPQGINAATKTKELETEKTMLNAQLAESRVSTMMSQIRPHFIYNTLGSIEQLCEIDPEKAGELVHNFAKYLRGNFGELDNPRPIRMSQEMEHVQYYISIEKVRFPDMTFVFEMDSMDFCLPALTIQPIVENAVKHGLMKRDKGGTIRVVSYETETHYCVKVEDDGVGFDPDTLTEGRAHMGIRNIRERLKAMVDGSVEIESTVGIGTKVLITIPKEVQK